MNATWSQVSSTSLSKWELRKTVAPRSRCARITSRTSLCPIGSRPGGWLIEKHDLRLMDQRLSQPEALQMNSQLISVYLQPLD
jgi:hypothetical protein